MVVYKAFKGVGIVKQKSGYDLYQEKGMNKIIDSKFISFLHKVLYKPLMILSATKVKYKLIKENKYTAIKGKPIIFVANHTRFQDTPIALKAVGKQAYIFSGKQKFAFEDELFFRLNGALFVDRKIKEDARFSKVALVKYLKRNERILYFPEGSWNLTDSLLIHHMKWGIIDIAIEADAQIIPLAIDYDEDTKKCKVRFEKPILPSKYKTKKEAIDALRDKMATMRWLQIESKEPLHRNMINVELLREKKFNVVREYPYYDLDYEQSCIYRPYESPDEIFGPIKKLSKWNF